MNFDVGASIPIQSVQLCILTGRPVEQIQCGHSFRWGTGMFRIESLVADEAIIIRLGSREIQALDQLNTMNPNADFHELDFWKNPGPQMEEPGRPTITGDFVDHTKKDERGRDTLEKTSVFPNNKPVSQGTPGPGLREPSMHVDDEVRTIANP